MISQPTTRLRRQRYAVSKANKQRLRCSFLLWLAMALSASPLRAEPVAIVHPDEAQTHSERKALRAAFSMSMQSWPDGSPLTVFVFRDENPLHQDFCRKVLGVLPYSLRRNWDRLLFSGVAQAPIVADSTQDMLQKVATTRGAIGYIDKDLVNASVAVVEIAR